MTDDKETVHFNTRMFRDDDHREIRSAETTHCDDDGRIPGVQTMHAHGREVLQTGHKDKVTCDHCLQKLYPTPAWRN